MFEIINIENKKEMGNEIKIKELIDMKMVCEE